MNKIVFELHPEDRARLDALTAALQELAPVKISMNLPKTPAPVAHPAEAEAAQVFTPAPAADPAPAPAAQEISLADFQKVITTLCASGPKLKEAVRGVITAYAGSVSEIPAEKRAEVLEKLEAINV